MVLTISQNWPIRYKCVRDGPILDISGGKSSYGRNVDLLTFKHVLGLTARLPGHVETIVLLDREMVNKINIKYISYGY